MTKEKKKTATVKEMEEEEEEEEEVKVKVKVKVEEKKAGISPDMESVIHVIENMTVLQLSQLVKAIEDKFGVTASAAIPVAATQPGGGAVAAEEKTEWTVVLAAIGDKKIQVIKEVRAITNLGLKEAKTLVEEAPKTVMEGITKEEAEKVKSKLESVGATVELK
ncbi:MAG: 50S ribosomal protein L7 [Firmicutes bacterium]|nr:50S ribosomal protein L7 [Bacillota bacterium]